MSDRPRAGGGGRQFTGEDWERGAARSGFRFLDQLGKSAIRNGERMMRHEQRMEQQEHRQIQRERQMEAREARRAYRDDMRHEQRMEREGMRRGGREHNEYGQNPRQGGREYNEYGGRPRNYQGARNDSDYGAQPGDRGPNGTRSDPVRQYHDQIQRHGTTNPLYGPQNDPAEIKRPTSQGRQPLPGELDGTGPSSMHMNLPDQPGVQVFPVADRGKIEVRELPPVRQHFTQSANEESYRQNAPKLATAANSPVFDRNSSKLTEDKRDYHTAVAQKGDTIWGLAENHYGKNDPKTMQGYVNAIAEANGMDAKAADNIKVGQEIKLPDIPRTDKNTPDVAGAMMAQNSVAPTQAPTQVASIKMDTPGMG